MSWGLVAVGVAGVIGGAYGVSEGNKQKNLARQAIKEGNPFGPYRQQYAEQLGALMEDPSEFLNNPLYKAAFGQGQQAVMRGFAGKGFIGSGNFAAGLQSYGMGFGWEALKQQERFLAELAGAQFPANPGPGLDAWGKGSDKFLGGIGDILGGFTSIAGGFGGGGGGTGGITTSAGGGFSDRRLKRNIHRIGTHRLGIGLYEWDFVWGEAGSGVMADEVEPIMPEAVSTVRGFQVVNYTMLESR